MHDYVRAAVVHSLQLPRICRGMQYAGFRRRAILYIISKLCTLVVEPGLSIVGRKSCLWIMGKRRKGGGRNTIRNYSICASRIRVVGGFGAGGSGDCFGRLATWGRRWRSRGCLEVCRAEHNVSNESSNSN